ncbi:ASCH domain-containing protein [Candidatus Woesearchaeota archaeon]|nr:ASCH domain-containing protein [Candidatus Woesearchaeota archaeon]
MKALSMKQPVPELILQGKKTIELRTWKSNFRGEFYLHASKNVIPRLMDVFKFKIEDLSQGAIVGKATIKDMKIYTEEKQFQKDADKHLVPGKMYKNPTYGYILEEPVRLEKPIPYKGQLSFFDVNLTPTKQLKLGEFK